MSRDVLGVEVDEYNQWRPHYQRLKDTRDAIDNILMHTAENSAEKSHLILITQQIATLLDNLIIAYVAGLTIDYESRKSKGSN